MKYKNLFEEDLPYTATQFSGSNAPESIAVSWMRNGGDLAGAPQECHSFNASHCEITSLIGGPRETKSFYKVRNNNLTSLEGAPEYVHKSFMVTYNEITSFEGCPKHITSTLGVGSNKIKSLVGIHEHVKQITRMRLDQNPIEEGGLGLLLIDGLSVVKYNISEENEFSQAIKIINKYLDMQIGEDGLYDCQKELIEADLEEFAVL